jgi:abortive infection bacteriophage resistance protein
MPYTKPWKNPSEQLDILASRGLVIGDKERALACLARIGYYRLSGYWFSFRERSEQACLYPKQGKRPDKAQKIALDSFKPNASFQNAVDLYVFDKQLRLLTMDALERIEIAVRVDISHMLGEFDRFAYLRPDLFHTKFTEDFSPKTGTTLHHDWLGNHARLVNRSREDFVGHNKEKYGLPLAIWIACEVWDFGTMSKLFDGMREQDQDTIALKYGIRNGRTFATWLRSLGYLRNVCAHHSRLWNRNMVSQPKLPPKEEIEWVGRFQNYTHGQSRCYMLLVMTRHLIDVINPNSSWKTRIQQHLMTFPNLTHLGLNLKGMGAIDGWDAFE